MRNYLPASSAASILAGMTRAAVTAITLMLVFSLSAQAQQPSAKRSVTVASSQPLDSILPVRGFCIDAPRPSGLDSFVRFIDMELAPRKVNTLFVLIDYHYQFKSHPELTDSFALSNADVKKIVAVCARHNIRIIPQINLLGHQGWENHTGKLLQAYPEFDETPWVSNPEHYVWPNADNLYCRSYCPLHPKVHEVLFAVIDEICDAFESTAFHGGMDEVFYLAESKCPRCGGRDPSVVFAGEVRTIHDHLAQKGRELWIWGDRLLDGRTTGLGMWEASYNNTYRAADLIPKDVVICDWHYERPDKTAVYFAMKGFRVVTCPWRDGATGITQVDDMAGFRLGSSKEMKPRFLGIVETTWHPAAAFLKGYYEMGAKAKPTGSQPAEAQEAERTPWKCFADVFGRINAIGN